LKDNEIIEGDFNGRKLSEEGVRVKGKFIELLKLFLAIERYEEYWNEHMINIPVHYLPFLHTLHHSEIIKDSYDNNIKAFNKVREMILNGK